ncbi:MAG: hypothetical protein RR555_05520 [Bacteroidales bacterium]
MRFTEIAAGDTHTGNMVQEILKKSPLLANYIEFFKKPGSSVSVRSGGSIDGLVGTTRAIGADYAAKTVAPEYKTASRKMLGDKIRIDVAYERMGYDINSEMLSQLSRRVREFGYMFNYALIKGDSTTTPTQFNGISKLITQARTVIAGENGKQLLLGNSDTSKKAQQELLELLDQTIAQCEGTNKVIIANSKTIARLNAVAREYLTITRNEFGVPITHYNQIPLINAGDYKSAQDTFAPILAFDETVGTSKDCASLYVASFEEEDGMSFATCEGGFMVYPIQKVGNFYECTFELIADSILIRESALSRLSGLRL